MGPQEQFYREVDSLENDLADGRISQDDFNRELREMQRDYRGAAEESAWDAHQNELDRW